MPVPKMCRVLYQFYFVTRAETVMCCTMMISKLLVACVCVCLCCMGPYKNLFWTPYFKKKHAPQNVLLRIGVYISRIPVWVSSVVSGIESFGSRFSWLAR